MGTAVCALTAHTGSTPLFDEGSDRADYFLHTRRGSRPVNVSRMIRVPFNVTRVIRVPST